jgi:transposase-like protein
VAEQRYQAVMAVISDGLSVSQAAEKVGVSRQTLLHRAATSRGTSRLGLAVRFPCRGPALPRRCEEPDLVDTAAAFGRLPDRRRRIAVIGLFALSCAAILRCAAPFADNLVAAGTELGIDRFLPVQWLAPLHQQHHGPELHLSNYQAGQPYSCTRHERALGPPRCAHQLDQPGHHLDADGSAGTRLPRPLVADSSPARPTKPGLPQLMLDTHLLKEAAGLTAVSSGDGGGVRGGSTC